MGAERPSEVRERVRQIEAKALAALRYRAQTLADDIDEEKRRPDFRPPPLRVATLPRSSALPLHNEALTR